MRPFCHSVTEPLAHATIRQGSDNAGYQPFALRSATRFDGAMGTRSRESIYGASVRAAAEQATEARKTADRLACRLGTSGCSAFRDRRSLLLHWAMP